MSKVDIHNTMSTADLIIRRIQLEERHRTIMEAWDDKSMTKTNKKLRAMYNELWEELEPLQKLLNPIQKQIKKK